MHGSSTSLSDLAVADLNLGNTLTRSDFLKYPTHDFRMVTMTSTEETGSDAKKKKDKCEAEVSRN